MTICNITVDHGRTSDVTRNFVSLITYNLYYSSKDKTDIDVIKEHGRFLWSEEDEATSWYVRCVAL